MPGAEDSHTYITHCLNKVAGQLEVPEAEKKRRMTALSEITFRAAKGLLGCFDSAGLSLFGDGLLELRIYGADL